MAEVVFTGLRMEDMGVRQRRVLGDLLAVQDVAKLCGVGPNVVYCRLHRKLLPPRVGIAGRWYWLPEQLPALREAVATPVKWVKKPRPRTLTPEDEVELLSLRRCGFAQRELAALFPLSQSQICRVLKRLEGNVNNGTKPAPTIPPQLG